MHNPSIDFLLQKNYIQIMFDPQELKQLEDLLDKSEQRMVGRIDEVEQRMVGRIDEVEQRMVGKIKGSEEKMLTQFRQLSDDLGELIDSTILPQIAEKADKADIERLERKIDIIIDKNLILERDVAKLKVKVVTN